MEYGGNSHFGASGTVYKSNPQGVLSAVEDLNWTILRDNGGPAGVQLIKGAGLRCISIANTALAAQQLLSGSVVPDYIEGPNEWNNAKYGMTPAAQAKTVATIWAGIVAARDTHTRVTGDRVPLIAPSLSLGDVAGAQAAAAALGPLQSADFANVHAYMGDGSAASYATKLQTGLQIGRQLAPGMPAVLTEFGSWWADGATVMPTGHMPTSPPDAEAGYAGWVTDIADAGFVIACQYETACETNHQVPAGGALYPTLEGWFGVLDGSLNDRPWTPQVRALALLCNAGPAALADEVVQLQAELALTVQNLSATTAVLSDRTQQLQAASSAVAQAMAALKAIPTPAA